jgi:hypothetical protein
MSVCHDGSVKTLRDGQHRNKPGEPVSGYDDWMIEMVGPVLTRALRSSSTVGTIRRADVETSMIATNVLAVRRALEAAGVDFIDENGGGAGVRLRKPSEAKPKKK